jgi:hypothetical protein
MDVYLVVARSRPSPSQLETLGVFDDRELRAAHILLWRECGRLRLDRRKQLRIVRLQEDARISVVVDRSNDELLAIRCARVPQQNELTEVRDLSCPNRKVTLERKAHHIRDRNVDPAKSP